ncbi:hypothetical protein SpCBS45565_g05631 [Spizellomyces sp. 'palustris']|nr:hypothetical protein SpCBS45565_g05631 [Spizellomyces sp. 'palustris']
MSSATSSSSTTSSARPSVATSRKRATSSASANSANSEDAGPSRPFTPDQVEGIKRIKACKANGDLYAILGLEKGCAEIEIKKAYRKLALQFHPDKCGAPGTDDAFKAIGHAFAVLGDTDKRAKYDRFGIDAEISRGGGGGGGFGGQGFAGSQFESEISPEDLFNMFFGDMGGMGGSGIRMHSFTAGPGFRTQSFRRNQHAHQHHPTAGQAQVLQFIHLLPVIVLFVFPLLSALFSGLLPGGDPEPNFSFATSPQYNLRRTTESRSVPYFVNTKAWNRWDGSKARHDKLQKYEQDVETEWHRNLQHLCAQEQEIKRFRIAQANGWFTVDEKKLRAAQEMKMQNCEKLRDWYR